MERGEGILGIVDRFNLKQVEWISEKTVDLMSGRWIYV